MLDLPRLYVGVGVGIICCSLFLKNRPSKRVKTVPKITRVVNPAAHPTEIGSTPEKCKIDEVSINNFIIRLKTEP